MRAVRFSLFRCGVSFGSTLAKARVIRLLAVTLTAGCATTALVLAGVLRCASEIFVAIFGEDEDVPATEKRLMDGLFGIVWACCKRIFSLLPVVFTISFRAAGAAALTAFGLVTVLRIKVLDFSAAWTAV